MRFVEDEDGALAGSLALDEEVIQRHESLRPRIARLGDPQVLEDVLEDAVKRQRRVDDERDRGLSVEALTKGVKQGRLARAHLAGQDDKALPLLGPVQELGQRLPVPRAHVEKLRVRGRVERLFRQPVERQVHVTILTRRHASRARPGARSRWRRHRRGRRSRRCRQRPHRRRAACATSRGRDRFGSRSAEY